MLIKPFEDVVDLVRRYRASDRKQPAKVMSALGAGYRISVPLDGKVHMFVLKGAAVDRLLAEFPGTTELWRLFSAE